MSAIISRAEARTLGLTRYFTGQPCKREHISERNIGGQCLECNRLYASIYRKANPGKMKNRSRRYYVINSEKLIKYQYIYRSKNSDKIQKQAYRYRLANAEKISEKGRKYYKKNSENIKRKQRQRKYRSYRHTPIGQLRKLCAGTAERLVLGSIKHSRLVLLDYNATKFIFHLESTLPKNITVMQAKEAGYHIDHIIPLALISKSISNKKLAFQIAMDLVNLRMISGKDNMHKHTQLDLNNEQQREIFEHLCNKYNVRYQFLSVLFPY